MSERTSVFRCRSGRRNRDVPVVVSTVVKADVGDAIAAVAAIASLSPAGASGAAEIRSRRRVRPVTGGDDHRVHVTPSRSGLVVSYPLLPGAGRQELGPWVAFVTFRRSGIAVTVTSRLMTRTVTDGVMANVAEYRWFLDTVATRLRGIDRRSTRRSAERPPQVVVDEVASVNALEPSADSVRMSTPSSVTTTVCSN